MGNRRHSVYDSSKMVKLRKTPLAKIQRRVPRIMKRMEQNHAINELLIKRTKPSEGMQRIIRNATRMDYAEQRVSAASMLKTIVERLLETNPKYAAVHKAAIEETKGLTLGDIANIMGRCRTDPDPIVQQVAVETITLIERAAPRQK